MHIQLFVSTWLGCYDVCSIYSIVQYKVALNIASVNLNLKMTVGNAEIFE